MPHRTMDRRNFLRTAAAGLAAASAAPAATAQIGAKPPNVVYVFADQWRADALGYAGDPNVKTPRIDALARESFDFTHAVAGMPVCTPYRGSLMTGRYWHRTGLFVNDVPLGNDAVSLAQAFAQSGYDTAYIGKWHIDGRGRSAYIPPERRQGFDYWKVLECTHNYNASDYYADGPDKLRWDGYDAIAQTKDACAYIADRESDKPFLLLLSWGPPHNPYETAPQKYKDLYDPAALTLRPNVPAEKMDKTRQEMAGYYAHCTALDDCVGDLLDTLDAKGIADDTIFVFTSDHGDMVGSQGEQRKQRPWDESIRVPFLIRRPGAVAPAKTDFPINTPDIMPTLLGLCDLPIPETVDGKDRSSLVRGEETDEPRAALLACITPFGEWTRKQGGREFRGVRTPRHTYIRTLEGPWLLFDNETDPYQLDNLADKDEHRPLRDELDALLDRKLAEAGDDFRPGEAYIAQWGYTVDENGTVPIKP